MTYARTLLTLLLSTITAALLANTGWFFPHDRMSSSLTSKICQDGYGYVWVGTEYGLNKFDGYRFTTYFHHDGDSTTIPDNAVSAFAVGRDSALYIGFSKGLARYDYATNTFHTYRFPDGVQPRVSSLIFDHAGTLLIGTAGYGLYRLDGGGPVIDTRYYRKDMNGYYSNMAIDSHGTLWCTSNHPGIVSITPAAKGRPQRRVSPFPMGGVVAFVTQPGGGLLAVCTDGIARYDRRTGLFADAKFDLSAMGNGVYISHACAVGGDIYVTTPGWGVGVIPRGSRTLKPIHATIPGVDIRNARVSDICRDREGNIWLACYRRGLLLVTTGNTAFHSWNFAALGLPLNATLLSTCPYDGGVLCAMPPEGCYRFAADGSLLGKVAAPFGTRTIHRDHAGQYWLGVGSTLYSFDPATGRSAKVLDTDGQAINAIADCGGRIYVSSIGSGLYAYDPRSHATAHYTMGDTKRRGGTVVNDWIMGMNADNYGLLWLCTTDGVSCLDTRTGSFRSQGWNDLLRGKACMAVAFTKQGVAIGTMSGLWLYDRHTRKAVRFPRSEQLDDKAVSDIVADAAGDLWISTMDGLWQWDHRTGDLIGHISGNGLTNKEYWPHLSFQTPDGLIGFGTPDGITAFRPDDVRRTHSYRGTIHLTNVVIGGKAVGTLADAYDVANDEKTITMEFSMLNYRYSDNVIYQYRVNKGPWTTTDDYSNSVTFNRLPYGDYTIDVRAMSNGRAIAPVKRVMVSVAPPWYLTTDAFVVYFLAAILAVAAAVFYYGRRKQRELEEAKMQFLINATHDIRSPLTLIISPLKKLRQRITDPESQRDLETIERNAGRLQTLVGQILDKRRIDKRQLQLHCRKTDLVQFTAAIITLYRYNANERGITLNFDHPDRADVWIDRNNFDKVVANLLSNAFKYTPDGGTITVAIKTTADTVALSVTDTGPGFGDANLKHVFDRFYQGDNSREMHVGGTGIGLNLCRALTRMHGGNIQAANRTDGQSGAIITVTLPTGNAHLKPEQIEQEPHHDEAETRRKQANRNISLMVVDDDKEIAAYIKQELADWYHIDIFPNGKEAYNALLGGKYDAVVSDVMMPEMDGIELLRAIKGNSNISDVPVILLTSKADVADRLEGLKRGADAYMAKPFNMDMLHATIDNVVDNVRRLRGKFSGAQAGAGMAETVEVKGNDDELMKRIMKSVNKNMDNSDFNVEMLCQDVGISRTQLHRKMKEIAGVSTSEFIRNLRLEQAARLLKEGKVNVTQVAYAVGFSNSAHFSTVFKKHFGVSPSEYSEKHRAVTE